MESITNTEDMLCNVLILALIVNDSLKSRVWENRKHGSVGVTIALKLNSILIWSKCYGFYLSLKKMQNGIFYVDNIIHTSFQNIFTTESLKFDPIFLKGEERCINKIRKKYFVLTRKNVMKFLKKKSGSHRRSLNKFARELYKASLPGSIKLDKSINVIADLSSKVNMFGNNEWNRIDLSGLNFTDIDLTGVNFSGSNLSNCIFHGADISNTNFESALMLEASFSNIISESTNFYHTDLRKAIFKNCQFVRGRFDWCILSESSFNSVNIRCSSSSNAKWNQINIENSNMNNSDFTGVDFKNSNFKNVESKYSIFNKSTLSRSVFLKCDFSYSLFNMSSIVHTIWNECVAPNIEAKKSNFTGSKISERSIFKKSNFSYSIFDGVKAPKVCFTEVIMDHAKIGYGKFVASCFDGASLKFTDLNSCVFSEFSASGIDLTGSKIFNIRMIKSDLKDSIFVGAEIKNSDLSKANFENSDWQNLYIGETLLEHINNHRIRINDNTELIDCVIEGLNGQFYHYDEDEFMDIMFIEQFESNIKRIENAKLLRKLGILGWVLRFISSEYNIPRKEIRRLHNIKLRNTKELRKYLKILRLEENKGVSLDKYKFMCTRSDLI